MFVKNISFLCLAKKIDVGTCKYHINTAIFASPNITLPPPWCHSRDCGKKNKMIYGI